ncbi:ferritin-like domain-containing protein [Nocardioides lentus]|uniref:Ferritin-like domain-containing protein n=1 Tax=Nocardioides lentus TaxID=338077 RepID=A0ABP5B0I5_9ACTN
MTAPTPDEAASPTPAAVLSVSDEALADDGYRAAVVDLVAAVAYGEISAFERLAEDAKLAPTLADKVELGSMAAAQLGHVTELRERLHALGVDPFEAMEPFREPIESFHRHTAPSDWWEGLVKAYVGDGLAADFYLEIAGFLDESTGDLITRTLTDVRHSEFVVGRVRAAIEADPPLGGRLALWGRRLMGEALSQAQRVAADREALIALVAGGVDRPGLDLAEVGRVFTRLTERHNERMGRLGLAF